MSRYLLHQTAAGTPVGVFTETDHYYRRADAHHETYGVAVVGARGHACTWDDFMEQQASKTPTPTAMWDIYHSHKTALTDVLDDAIRDTTYGDVDPQPFTKITTDLAGGTLSAEDREAWLQNHGFPDATSDEEILLAIGAGFG